jgi:hypothetical protein
MIRSTFTFAAFLLLIAVANSQGPPKELQDPFLDSFVGDWQVERKFPSGRTLESTVRGEWVLKHHFVELHYGHADAMPQYEAIVFIGYDAADQSYVCHWIDIFGGRYSALGRGKIDNDKHSIKFRFESKEGALTNKFTFDPQTKTWTSLICQEEKGEWKTFAEEKFTRAKR